MNAYFKGEIYYSQNNHTGKSSLFLKNPLNKTNGRIIIGTKILTNWALETILPNKSPKELPAKDIKKKIK